MATFSGALMAGAWLAGIPTRIAHFRSDGDGHPPTRRRKLQRRLMTLLIRQFATTIVGVSPSSLSLGYRTDWELDPRARVIPNGIPEQAPGPDVDLRRSLGAAEDALILLHVGRPSPEKNRVWAVSVLGALRARGQDAHLVFIGGDGVDSQSLADGAERTRLTDFVHHLGSQRAVREYMSEADVLVLPSFREGLPGVVLECLSVGTPVVASDLPGARFIGTSVHGVECVGLDESADSWATAVITARQGFGSDAERESIRRQFAASPFALCHSVQAHAELYEAA